LARKGGSGRATKQTETHPGGGKKEKGTEEQFSNEKRCVLEINKQHERIKIGKHSRRIGFPAGRKEKNVRLKKHSLGLLSKTRTKSYRRRKVKNRIEKQNVWNL